VGGAACYICQVADQQAFRCVAARIGLDRLVDKCRGRVRRGAALLARLYTGQSLQEYQGSGWASCLHPDERESIIASWEHAVVGGGTYFNHGRIWSAKHGAYRRFQMHAIAMRNKDGEVLEWYGTLVDVQDAIDRQTELKDIREDLAQTLQALRVSEAKTRTQAEQLNAVSDELSTILNTAGIGITRCSRELRYLRAN